MPPFVTYLVGGYLFPPNTELSLNYRLLTSKDYENFVAYFNSIELYKEFFGVISGMQRVPFMVNEWLLQLLKESKDILVDAEPLRAAVDLEKKGRTLPGDTVCLFIGINTGIQSSTNGCFSEIGKMLLSVETIYSETESEQDALFLGQNRILLSPEMHFDYILKRHPERERN